MSFTNHGHHIPGTVLDQRPSRVARCGGPRRCDKCADDVLMYWKPWLTQDQRTKTVAEQLQALSYSQGTIFKVYDALKAAGLTQQQATDAINQMQNQGIYFREAQEA